MRLTQGSYEHATVYGSDPIEIARRFAAAGAQRLHVVDLDAARGVGDNRNLVSRLVAEAGAEIQVAGGVRSAADADRWIAAGAAAVAMGTAAVRDPVLLARVARRHPGRVLAALDVRGGRPAVSAWGEVTDLTVAEMLARWADAPLAGLVVTSVDRDGTLAGPDLGLLADVTATAGVPVAYSGGVGSLADVRAVAGAGAAAVILGRSLLEGLIRLADVLALSS